MVSGSMEKPVLAACLTARMHPDRVPCHPAVRITDDANYTLIEILNAADIINNRIVFDFIKQGIDRQITPEGIFRKGSEGIVARQDLVRPVPDHIHSGNGGLTPR